MGRPRVEWMGCLSICGAGYRLATGLAVVLLLCAGCGPADRDVTRGTITVAGSGSADRLVRAAADTFAALYPKATILVEGGGTVLALEALLNQEADIAVLSREPLEEEKEAASQIGVEIVLFPFALDGLAIVVHRDNPVYALGFREVQAVFSGEVRDWSELGGDPGWIRVYRTGVEDGALAYVSQEVLDGGSFVEGAGRALTTSAVVDSVASHVDAIGYASMADVDERVKALPISKGATDVAQLDEDPEASGPLVNLNIATVLRKQYPLVRTLYFGTRGTPWDNLVSGFVSFMTSTRGQRIVVDSGLVPATVPVRLKPAGSSP